MKNTHWIKAILLVLIGFTSTAQDTVLVKAVHDGDSYKVLHNGETYWVRLANIDAPEVISNRITKKQTYGTESGNFVRDLIKNKYVTMVTHSNDLFDRPVVSIWLENGQRLDSLLVANGHAWHKRGSNVARKYKLKGGAKIQKAAQDAKLGLWNYPKPIRPSVFRKKNILL